MILGSIEISNRSLRFSVTEVEAATSIRLVERFHSIFAREENLDRLATLIVAEAEAAREAGAVRVEVTAGPDLRGTTLAHELNRVCASIGADNLKIPSAHHRAEAAFMGVTVPGREQMKGEVAVALVGERTVSVAAGSPGHLPHWVASRPVGALSMTEKARFSDPPRPVQIDAAISGSTRQIASLMPPAVDKVLVASDFAPVVERLCGSRFDREAARRGLDAVLGLNSDDLSAWFGIAPGLSRYLPGTLVCHLALAEALDCVLEPVVWEPVAGSEWLVRETVVSLADGIGKV